MNPFEALGIAPTTDRAAIRRAYAQGTRRHRPEDDPAGFRAVRDAYETLTGLSDADLASLVAGAPPPRAAAPAHGEAGTPPAGDAAAATPSGETPSGETPPGETPPGETPPGETEWAQGIVVPPAWAAALREARDRAPGPARDEAVVAALASAARDADADPALWLAWQKCLGTGLEGRGDLLVELMPPERVVALLRHAPTDLVPVVAPCLVGGRRWGRLRATAEAVLAAAPPLDAPDAAPTLRALAVAMAVLDPAMARALADRAFTIALPAARSGLGLDAVDALARVGDEWVEGSGSARTLLTSIVAGAYDPAAPAGGEDDLVRRTGRLGGDSATAQLLRELAPPLFERAAAAAGAAADATAARTARRARADAKTPSRWGGLRSIPWYVIVAVLGVLRLVATCTSAARTEATTPRVRLLDPNDVKVRIETDPERIRQRMERWSDRKPPPAPAPGTPPPGSGR